MYSLKCKFSVYRLINREPEENTPPIRSRDENARGTTLFPLTRLNKIPAANGTSVVAHPTMCHQRANYLFHAIEKFIFVQYLNG